MGVYFLSSTEKSVRTEGTFSQVALLSPPGAAEEAPPAEETDAQPVKRAAEEEEVG